MRAPLYIIALSLLAASPFAHDFKIRVSARADLSAAILSSPVPNDFPDTGLLTNGKENIPFQKLPSGELLFIPQNLRDGETRIYKVQPQKVNTSAQAKVVENRVELLSAGKHLLTYQGAETDLPRPDIKAIYKRGGYIHPILTPSGKLLTDDYSSNHLHHHGVWAPWTKTEFEGRSPDFWNMGEGKGRVEFVKLGTSWSGPLSAGFTAEHRFVDLTSGAPKTVLNETWTVQTYALPGADCFIFDLVSTQTCATASALILPKYLYGGLGFRGNWGWNGEDKCSFLTSNGETDRVKGNETRANWCYIGGDVDGAPAGLTIFCDPANFRAPQPMRLHPKEPFFCFAPSQLGDWSIEPGKPYVSRYRFLVKDGQPVVSRLEDAWKSFAQPPTVTVTRR